MAEFSEDDIADLRALIQLRRDYLAYGRAGGFLLTVVKWIAAITAGVILIQQGLQAFIV